MLILAYSLISCEDEGGENETKISYHGESESHKMGQNCMDCHKSGGQGEGWFTMGGTVYDSLLVKTYPNSTVYLYSASGGTGNLKYTLQGDALGNFYTTEYIDFDTGLYASVEGENTTKHMNTVLPNGKCNGCHGASTNKIWTK